MDRERLVHREEVEIRTADGVALRATVVEPASEEPRVVAVLAHAMFARRTEFDRPSVEEGWLDRLARAGARAIAFDFRGHGDSGTPASKGGFWSYDDLVQRDLPAVVGAARARAEGAKVVIVGHSMGGSVALAAQGARFVEADAIVTVATHVYLPRFDRSPVRKATVYALLEGMRRTTARVGYFPARTLRQGSDDEAAPFVHDVLRFFHDDAWKSADGLHDYVASLANVHVPVLAIVSESDRVQCAPACAKEMMKHVTGPTELRLVSEGDGGSSAPSHMDLVVGEKSRCVRDLVVRWVLER